MHINRSLLNWGVFFIALGGIPLAVDEGWLEPDIAGDLGQLWPLILVGIGLGLILRWTPLSWFGGALVAATFGIILGAAAVTIRDDDFANLQGIIPAVASGACASGDVGSSTTSQNGLASGDQFELDVTISCGELEVTRAAGASWSVVAQHDPDDTPSVDVAETGGAATRLRLNQNRDEDFVFLGRQVRSEWQVEVPSGAALDIASTLNAVSGEIDAGSGPISRVAATLNATDATFDLADASTPAEASIDLTLNASDASLLLPAGDLSAGITLNASSLVICVPSSAGLRIDHSAVLGSDDLAASGLEEASSGEWVTPDLSSAEAQVSLSITNTVSSFSIERPETCS